MWHATLDTWHMTSDTWHLNHDTWHLTRDMWHVTRDTWHVTHGGGWTLSQNCSLRLVELDQSVNESISNKGVYRTAPDTLGLGGVGLIELITDPPPPSLNTSNFLFIKKHIYLWCATHEEWHMTHDIFSHMWHMTHDTLCEGEYSFKISAL